MNEHQEIANVPYIVYESAQTRMERIVKRLVIALIVAVVLIFVTNAVWIYCWMQYDYTEDTESISVDSEGDGDANYIGNDGEISYGIDKSDENYTNETETNK
jgi:hypothetical protein